METIQGGWDKVEVADAQLSAVTKELDRVEQVGPFAAFIEAMNVIGLNAGTLLDVGCGVGHYCVLCNRYFPSVHYTGSDASAAMIECARKFAAPGSFVVSDFENNDFGFADIVLLSQVVEITDNPVAMLKTALEMSRHYVILNRIRLTLEPSHAIEETTYCGNVGCNWLWNIADIESIVTEYGTIVHESIWDNKNQATFVVDVNHDKHTI